MAGFARRQIARSVPLPVLPLATDLAKFRASVAFMDRAEGCASFDGLQLLRISNQDRLGSGLSCMGQYPFQLPRTDHARLVDHQHIEAPGAVAAPAPARGDSPLPTCRVPTIPASSITSTSRLVSPSRPWCQPCSMLAMVRDAMPDPLSRFSAAMPDSP